MLKSLPLPAPIAVISACASALSITCFIVAFPALTTLPRNGRIAIYSASRPAFAGPAAESPSTIRSSLSSPWVLQSASLSGMPVLPKLAALRFASRTSLEATRFKIAFTIFSRTALIWVFFPAPSNQSERLCFVISYTML